MNRSDLPKGKGWYIWCIKNTMGGTPYQIAMEAKRMGLSYVILHIHDGYLDEQHVMAGADLTPYIEELERVGIACWAWGAVYSTTWLAGANRVIEAFRKHPSLRGYFLDAEAPIKGAYVQANNIMVTIRNAFPNMPIGISSYRYPRYHPDLPWKEFRALADFDAPQVYWEKATNSAAQLFQSYTEFQAMDIKLPYVPSGSAYKNDGWSPTVAQIREFTEKARELKLPGVNFWVWWQAQRDLPLIYKEIADYAWTLDPDDPTPLTMEEKVEILWKEYLKEY